MNIKSIMSLTLAAAAVACVSVTPAQANNNQYLNNLAMQMYMQNMAANQAPVNPYLVNPSYNVSVPTPVYTSAIPAYSAPVYTRYYAPRVAVHRHWWR